MASNPRRLETLVGVTLGIHAEHKLEGVLQRVADAAREITGAQYAALGVLDASGQALNQFVVSGISPEAHAKIGDLPTGRGVLGVLIRDPHALRLRDISRHPNAHGFPPHHPPMKSFLGVPIVGRKGVFGNLYLTNKIGGEEFSADDEAVALMLAAQAAVAIDNAHLLEDTTRLLAEVRAMQGSRDRFFAMINHELRNALTAVYGWADLLIRKAGDSAPKAAREVYESAERTLGLLNDLLDMSRLEASRLKPVISKCDAYQLSREASVTVEPTAGAKGVRIDVLGAAGEIVLETDSQRVRQILVNLLSNAVRHSPDRETVRVEIKAANGRVRFDVVDHGSGIAPEDQGAIFDAFIQAGSQERGTGLGLTLSRMLARFLGGDLTVESQVGSGSRFSLEVPGVHREK
jgi:signal transduction histidine kinase